MFIICVLSISLISVLYYFCPFCFEFNFFFLLSFLRWQLRSLILDFFPLNVSIFAFMAVNFFLYRAVAVSYKFWHLFQSLSFSSVYFLISFFISSLTHQLFRHMLFDFEVLGDFPEIFYFFFYINYFIPTWAPQYKTKHWWTVFLTNSELL